MPEQLPPLFSGKAVVQVVPDLVIQGPVHRSGVAGLTEPAVRLPLLDVGVGRFARSPGVYLDVLVVRVVEPHGAVVRTLRLFTHDGEVAQGCALLRRDVGEDLLGRVLHLQLLRRSTAEDVQLVHGPVLRFRVGTTGQLHAGSPVPSHHVRGHASFLGHALGYLEDLLEILVADASDHPRTELRTGYVLPAPLDITAVVGLSIHLRPEFVHLVGLFAPDTDLLVPCEQAVARLQQLFVGQLLDLAVIAHHAVRGVLSRSLGCMHSAVLQIPAPGEVAGLTAVAVHLQRVCLATPEGDGHVLLVVSGDRPLTVLGMLDDVPDAGNSYEYPTVDVPLRTNLHQVRDYGLRLAVLSLQLLPLRHGSGGSGAHLRRHLPATLGPALDGADGQLDRLGLVVPVPDHGVGDVLDVGRGLRHPFAPPPLRYRRRFPRGTPS